MDALARPTVQISKYLYKHTYIYIYERYDRGPKKNLAFANFKYLAPLDSKITIITHLLIIIIIIII